MDKNIVFIDLDSIFDTRIGVLTTMDTGNLQLLDSKWFIREKDEWPDTDMETYTAMYADRDVNILKASPITNILPFIKALSISTIAAIKDGKAKETIEVLINTYPYILSDVEKEEIAKAVQVHTLIPELPKFINQDPTQIGYGFITGNGIRTIVTYDYRTLLDTIADDDMLKKDSLATVVLFAPMLIHGKLPNDIDSIEKVFKAAEEIIAPIISVKFLPVGHYSSIVKFEK